MNCRATVSRPPVCPAVPKRQYEAGACCIGWTDGGVIHDCALREGHEEIHTCFCGVTFDDDEDDAA